MSDANTIRAALGRELLKIIRRRNERRAEARARQKKYEKRSGQLGGLPQLTTPLHWQVNPRFNPFYVRSRLDSFVHALTAKARSLSYVPDPSLTIEIPKPSGGTREICVSTVPDAALSYWLGRKLIERNSYRFSSYSYAYRADRNAHHAIDHLMTTIKGKSRLFVLEYDFARYFDSIRHDYLSRVLNSNFLVTDQERALLDSFLKNRRARNVSDYKAGIFGVPSVGIPQGSNISLFLANVACYELDREIEQVGVTFARYADDTLVVCDSYEKADQCAKILLAHGDRSGAKINFGKSPGVSLLTPDTDAEIKHKASVHYLSHSLSLDGVRIAPKAISRIKRRVVKIIYNNLLLQPKRQKVNPARLGPGYFDWDLVTCVNELRRYIYGRISEAALSKALSGTARLNATQCAMSFYPTVTDLGDADIKALDGWLCDIVCRAYKKRCDVLISLGVKATPLLPKEIIDGSWYVFSVPVETKLPSFFRAFRYVKKAAKIFGLSRFPSPGYNYS